MQGRPRHYHYVVILVKYSNERKQEKENVCL
jgi:hypothetical protein